MGGWGSKLIRHRLGSRMAALTLPPPRKCLLWDPLGSVWGVGGRGPADPGWRLSRTLLPTDQGRTRVRGPPAPPPRPRQRIGSPASRPGSWGGAPLQPGRAQGEEGQGPSPQLISLGGCWWPQGVSSPTRLHTTSHNLISLSLSSPMSPYLLLTQKGLKNLEFSLAGAALAHGSLPPAEMLFQIFSNSAA